MSFQIEGKTVLVTGTNRGIGKAFVEGCLAHGAKKVYAAVRDPKSAEPLVKQFGDRVVSIELDLNKPETIAAAAKKASDVDLVVSNAGMLRNATPLSNTAIDDLKAEMEVNVYGLIRMAQAFAPVLKANGGGAFVQLNSVASLKCFPDFATYSASKAASYSITQALREKLGEQNTQVLSIHPGPIATDMANAAGLGDIADPPQKVADGMIKALAEGQFHLFPDKFAEQIGTAYAGFAKNVVEAAGGE